jgi:thiol-disulfide isomerase/thioredoxin
MNRRTPAVLAALLGLCLLVTGCSETRGGAEGFVSGSGTLTMVPPGEREPAPEIEGQTLDGKPLSLADYDGQVRVLNVWGSWCGPCRSEAPELVAAAKRLADDGVQFVGINVRDHGQREAAKAFARRFEVPYPSLYDPDGSTLLGLRPRASAIPSTLVVDAEGRVAAAVLGEVTESTLVDLVHDVQDDGRG